LLTAWTLIDTKIKFEITWLLKAVKIIKPQHGGAVGLIPNGQFREILKYI